MASSGSVTEIDQTYLTNLQTTLQDILTGVEGQLRGLGTAGANSTSTIYIGPVDSSLTVKAGPTSFDAGAALDAALKTMGGSVHDQLEWLEKVLTDMISEINTTVSSFGASEQLNEESVDQLMSDFQTTISDMNTPPGSGTPTPS
jgi:hypothetical protein